MKKIILPLLGLTLIVVVYIAGERTSDKIDKDGIDLEFSSVVIEKWERCGTHFKLGDGTEISRFILDTEMDVADVGDSLIDQAQR